MKNVTFDTIANALGVSKGLVSLAMRNKYGVSEEMRSKIILKAVELGYDFEPAASRMRNVALFLKRMDVMREEFWREIISGIEKQAVKEKVMLKIMSSANADENQVAANLYDTKVCGAIFLNQAPTRLIGCIAKFNIPVMLVDMITPVDGDYDQIAANNHDGGVSAVKYLIAKGHRDIVFFGNKDYSSSFRQRYYGCQYAVNRAAGEGVQVNYLVLSGAKKQGEGLEIYEDDDNVICSPDELEKFLARDKRYTAVICMNDGSLKFALGVFNKLGRRIGEDISVISFDNTSVAKRAGITSVSFPKQEMGESAVRLLLDKVNKTRQSTATLQLNTSIVERESVKDIAINGSGAKTAIAAEG